MTNDDQGQALPEIKHTILINAPIEKVWQKVSSEGIEAWFMPNDFKAEVGYAFHLQSPFGPSPCKVLEINAPNQLSFSWDTEGWIVTFQLAEVDDQTEFTLIHGGWKAGDEILPKANASSAVIRERMDQGWAGIVQALKQEAEQA